MYMCADMVSRRLASEFDSLRRPACVFLLPVAVAVAPCGGVLLAGFASPWHLVQMDPGAGRCPIWQYSKSYRLYSSRRPLVPPRAAASGGGVG